MKRRHRRYLVLFAALLGIGTGFLVWSFQRDRERQDLALRDLQALDAPESPPVAGNGDRVPSQATLWSAVDTNAAAQLDLEPKLTLVQTRFLDINHVSIGGVRLYRGDGKVSSGVPTGVIGVSDSQGRVAGLIQVDASAPRQEYFEVRHVGFAFDRRAVQGGAGEPFWLGDWILRPDASVTGIVVDAQGAGVADARVGQLQNQLEAQLREGNGDVAWEQRRCDAFASLWSPGAQVCTGPDGSFFLAGLPAGSLRLVAVAGRRSGHSRVLDLRELGFVDGVTLRLKACDPREVRGVVLDPHGGPLPFARLRMDTAGVTHDDSADAQGRFVFRCPTSPGGRKQDRGITVRAFDPKGRYQEARASGVRPGGELLRLRLETGRSVELRVSTLEGRPIESFAFEVTGAGGASLRISPGFPMPVRYPQGLAPLLLPQEDFFVSVVAAAWHPVRLGPLSPASVDTEIRCELGAGGEIRGVVRDEDRSAGSRGVSAATVGLYAAVEGPTLLNGFSVHRSTRPDSIARTDAEGRFNLALRRAGRYYFVADADGFPSKEVGPFRIEIDSRLEETILLQRAGALRVTVRSPDAGRETTGAVVGISRGDGRGLTRRCGAEGSVLFEGLAPGPWLARIVEKEIVLGVELVQPDPTGPKQVPTNCVVRSGEVTEFELQSGEEELSECVLAGRLRINGKPAEGWIAYLRANDRFLGDPAPLSGGVFQVGADRAGPYGVLLRGPEGRMILDTVELVPGQQTWALEIELAAWEAPALPTPEEGMLVVHEWARGQVRFWTPLLSGLSATPLAALRVPAGPGRILQYAAGRSLESQTPVVIALVEASPRED